MSKRSCQNKMTLEVPKIFNKLGETELMKVLPTGRPSLTQEHVSFISLEKVCSEKPNRARRRGDASPPARRRHAAGWSPCRRRELASLTLLSLSHRLAMMRSFLVACAVMGVASEAVELTPDNFDAEVTQSGKVCVCV